MQAKLTEKQRDKIASKLIDSNTFKNAPTSIALLQYLYNKTKKGTHLKESIIDIEFFKNQNAGDRNNPRVRVNVHNLRKKIVQFYETEGKDDVWRLNINKGQYQVSFHKNEQAHYILKKLKWSSLLPYMFFLAAVLIIVKISIPQPKPSLWKTILSKDTSTNLYIGDHFGITGKTITRNNGWTRDFSINSADEFYNFIDSNPNLKDSIKPSNYSYSTRMAALSTQKFQSFFQNFDKKFSIRFSTQTSTSEIKEGHALYAGPSKNNNQFLYFFNESNPYFEISDTQISLFNHPVQKDTIFNLNSGDVSHEYAVVSKYKSGDTEHFVFFSQHDIGVSATVEYFTNIDSIQKFQDTYLKNNNHFTAIFEVKGQDRTNTSLKLIEAIGF
ncbi:hypothetical protein [Seonamhaeicola maritimus]|uniref:hypothetical protein n=1 Tax=Seonamhaeicola maritimus TaxID=2591822 RepID=UPI0024949DF5|nr:hypothetical protein [Seonamhaeicola maritimus]